MEYTLKTGDAGKQRYGCVAVAVFEKRHLSKAAEQLDRASKGAITNCFKQGDTSGTLGKVLMLHHVPGIKATRVALVGCGAQAKFDARAFERANAALAGALADSGASDALSYLTSVEVADTDYRWRVRSAVIRSQDSWYRYATGKRHKACPAKLKQLAFALPTRREVNTAGKALAEGEGIARGMALTRELGNTPANICTPSHLASQARKLASKRRDVKVTVLDEKQMKSAGMGALLSVSAGSRQPAKLISIEYRGAPRTQKPVVLVGKGVTFDSGGISIKPSAAMDEMKFDMCGAATVLGVMQAVIDLKLPINVTGVIPSTENLPDGLASKPGDVVTSMSGQTIEILNTDAEGRLILCDALTWAGKFKPDVVIDIATLTGACVIALGNHHSGVLGNDDALVGELLEAGKTAGDRAWQLPITDDYDAQLKSNFADMANIGGREAGTITAACFLARFTGDYRWAHLDIAGTAWKSGAAKGATGRPVPLLMQFLLNRC